MSKEKWRVPKLRFPGFTEDWEQRKFSDLYEKISEKNDLSYSLDKIISVANMYYKSDAKVSNEEYLKTYNIFRYGEIAFEGNKSKDFAYGRFVENTIGDGIISHVFEVFRPISKYDIYFWKYYINYEPIMGKVLSRCTKKTTMMTNLVAKDFLKETVLVPTLAEQKQIGTLLNALDKSITLHQHKLDNLKLKKKALLQKLFPKNGERYPELRFPGFTDAWEQRKLNEFLSVSNLKNTENKYNKKNVLSVSGDYGIVNQIEFQGRSFAGASVSNYGVVEKGDIVYTKSPLKLNPYGIIKTNRINNGIVSTLYAIYKTKENCDSKFIEHYFNLDSRLNQYLKPLVNKGAKNDMKVSSENALVGEICFPQITEQEMIADLLDRLDIYITLHQRKLDHLQLQKKALLQQMFV